MVKKSVIAIAVLQYIYLGCTLWESVRGSTACRDMFIGVCAWIFVEELVHILIRQGYLARTEKTAKLEDMVSWIVSVEILTTLILFVLT